MKTSPAPSIDLAGAAKTIAQKLGSSQSDKPTGWNVKSPKFWITIATTVITLVFSGGMAYSKLESNAQRMEATGQQVETHEASIGEIKSEQRVGNVKLESMQRSQEEMAKDVKEIRSDLNQIQQDIAAIKEAVKH